ncbi:hypothetical protein TSAR_002911 [Trichomalopsis sarcophagae]|uniref:Uncharacterized protein n=1 Tax=Trichomalopsis sarcophagae TaxID=543379 RepID=A0A232ESM3_9HYME|nr:hypothetical protein TSAR_002911 [Trichomalopsis sarcophagae]
MDKARGKICPILALLLLVFGGLRYIGFEVFFIHAGGNNTHRKILDYEVPTQAVLNGCCNDTLVKIHYTKRLRVETLGQHYKVYVTKTSENSKCNIHY